MKHSLHRRISRFAQLPVWVLLPAALFGDQDAIEGPWGTVHADLAGTASSTELQYLLGTGPMEEKWRVDIVGEGHDRAAGRSSITFDKDGNLYWLTNTGGGTGGQIRIVSVSTDGKIRWSGNDGNGNLHVLGSIFSGSSPVVGVARVYAAGDQAGTLILAAYDKATGKNLWTADLSPSVVAAGFVLTPALYQGKVYVVGSTAGKSGDIYRVDAETGNVDWSTNIAEVGIQAGGQAAFVPEAFGAGIHGLYFNGDSGMAGDGNPDVYGIKLTDEGAEFGWANDGGKVARSHVIYSETTALLYTFTWTDYGAEAYVFDPATGLVSAYNNTLDTGHGFYDVASLEFDGGSVIAGGFSGNILRYTDDGSGNLTDTVVYKGGTAFNVPYWGETRVLGQLLRNEAGGNSVLITATNSFQCCASHVVAVDVTEGKLLWEYDTKNRNDHNFLYAGGPLSGPDGKIYFFERPAGGATALVAIGKAEIEPAPTAGFIVVGPTGAPVGTAPGNAEQPCLVGGLTASFDAGCSTGTGLTYRWSAEPPDGVTVLPHADGDPAAEIRFENSGIFEVILEVENERGTAECRRPVCVDQAQPTCALAVTDAAGKPIDNADDDDEIPCLPAGGIALADAVGSTGGDLEYAFSVTPGGGTTIDQVDSSSPRASITITEPGIYQIGLNVSNAAGETGCNNRTICVTAEVQGKRFQRGDCNADHGIDISDAVINLGILFLGEPAPQCADACDSNADDQADISDAVYLLGALFLGGPLPSAPYPDCGVGPERLGCATPTC